MEQATFGRELADLLERHRVRMKGRHASHVKTKRKLAEPGNAAGSGSRSGHLTMARSGVHNSRVVTLLTAFCISRQRHGMSEYSIADWQKYGIGYPSGKKNVQMLRTVSHVTHIPSAISIFERNEISAGLVYDKSRLNQERIHVA